MPWIPWGQGLCLVPLSLLVINNFIMCGGWIFWTEFVSLYLNCLLKFYKSNGRVCTRKILISQRVKAEFHWKFHETPIKFNSESVEPFFFSYKHTLELALRGKQLEKVILWCDHVFFRDWKESHNAGAGARRSNKSEQWWWVLIWEAGLHGGFMVAIPEPPWTIAHQPPLSKGFSRQEYWSRLPFPFSRASTQPRDRTPVCSIASGFFTNWARGKPRAVTLRESESKPS